MFRNLIIRDLKIAFFTSTNFLFTTSFFLLILILIPFIFGSEVGLLKIMFKGLIWIALVLSILLTLARIFNSDYDDGNLDIIIRSVSSLESIIHKIKPGVTEKQFASDLVIELLRNGSDSELPFSPIVASGFNAANPHHFPIDKEFEKGDLIIIDWGANYEGYFSDITRTFAIGNIDSRLQSAYSAVKNANLAARELAKSGVQAGLVDSAARNVIDEAGFGEYFTHRTGHGLGLEIHEEPYIKPDNDFVLESGMTFTIEPGIYIPNLGGIRIEDDVLVENNQPKVLSSAIKELDDIQQLMAS